MSGISVAMATCDGEPYIGAQLDSTQSNKRTAGPMLIPFQENQPALRSQAGLPQAFELPHVEATAIG